MQQRFRKLALFIGAAAFSGASVLVVACGTDNGTATPTPQVDGSKPVGDGGKPDGNVDPETDGSVQDGNTPDCSRTPILKPTTAAGGFLCAFYKGDAAVDGAAGLSNCTSGQTCCNPAKADGGPFDGKFPPSFCAQAKGGDTICAAEDTAHDSDYQPDFFANSWECAEKANCLAGQTCVMVTAVNVTAGGVANVGKDTKAPSSCNVYKAFKQGGSRCKTGAAAQDEVLLCSTDAECGTGTACKPFNAGGLRDLGSCRP